MKICRFVGTDLPAPRFGILEGDSIAEITGVPWGADGLKKSGRSFSAASVRLVAPVAPSKIVCVGRNYAAHAAELGNDVPKEPLIFLKPPSSIVGPGEPIVLPKYSNKVEHEGELGLVVGRRAAHLSKSDDALSYLCGYTCALDFADDDAGARRFDCHGNAGRCGAAGPWRQGGGLCRGDWSVVQSGAWRTRLMPRPQATSAKIRNSKEPWESAR